jgi:hypothetical protein
MTTVIFRSRLHWEGATRAVLKSSSENHVSEEHFSNWQGRAMTRWQSDRVIVSDPLLPVTTSRYQARQDLAAPDVRTLAAKVIRNSSGGSMVDSPHRDDLPETREVCPRCQLTRLFCIGLTA